MFSYYKKFELSEICQSGYEEEIVRSESIEEIVDIVEDMLVTLMTQLSSLIKESQDMSDLSRSKQVKNIQETIKAYEKELKNTAKVIKKLILGFD
jgi:cob(I)alamin adenosyltransferase